MISSRAQSLFSSSFFMLAPVLLMNNFSAFDRRPARQAT
jgi:hypothetical protein